MTFEQLRDRCVAKYGLGWQTKLAKAIGVSTRTVRRWVSARKFPHWLPAKLEWTRGNE